MKINNTNFHLQSNYCIESNNFFTLTQDIVGYINKSMLNRQKRVICKGTLVGVICECDDEGFMRIIVPKSKRVVYINRTDYPYIVDIFEYI